MVTLPSALLVFGVAAMAQVSRGDVVQHLRTQADTWSHDQVQVLADLVYELSYHYDLDPELVLAVMSVESGFRLRARSRVGALGLMQVMPSTGRLYAHNAGVRWRGARTLYDPVANVRIGTRYLAWLIGKFQGNLPLALTSYCHGIGRVKRTLQSQGRLSYRTLRYSRRVFRHWAELRRERELWSTAELSRPYREARPGWKRYAGSHRRTTPRRRVLRRRPL